MRSTVVLLPTIPRVRTPPVSIREVMGALIVAAATALAACGGSGSPDVGDDRADQARNAALDAGLDTEVAEFLALAARGATATYQVTYPGPTPDSKLVVANRPPDRRVDVVSGGEVHEVRLVVDGEALTCARPGGLGDFEPCVRTDAVADPPGAFGPNAIAELTESLRDRVSDFAFAVEPRPVAGVEATCLVTRILAGRERPELGDGGTLCVSPEGALLLVDQGDEQLEASDYSTDVADGTFTRPDGDPSDR